MKTFDEQEFRNQFHSRFGIVLQEKIKDLVKDPNLSVNDSVNFLLRESKKITCEYMQITEKELLETNSELIEALRPIIKLIVIVEFTKRGKPIS